MPQNRENLIVGGGGTEEEGDGVKMSQKKYDNDDQFPIGTYLILAYSMSGESRIGTYT